MSYIEKEKLIKADIASIENRVRHAFNQGYDLGFKDGKEKAKPQEQELCDDWYDVPSDEMTLKQARQAVKDLRKKLVEYLEQERTTKNDLGVQKIVDVLGSYTDLDIPYKQKIAEDILNNLSSVIPQNPKSGHWVKYGIPRCGEQHYKCTNCDEYFNFGLYSDYYKKAFKFCPNCGCAMVEPQESEDKE